MTRFPQRVFRMRYCHQAVASRFASANLQKNLRLTNISPIISRLFEVLKAFPCKNIRRWIKSMLGVVLGLMLPLC